MFFIRYLIVFILLLSLSSVMAQTDSSVNIKSASSKIISTPGTEVSPSISPPETSIEVIKSNATQAVTPAKDALPSADMTVKPPVTRTVTPGKDMATPPSVDMAVKPSPVTEGTSGEETPGLVEKNFVPVMFYGEEVFSINNSLGPYSPDERARVLEDRLKKVSELPVFLPEEIKVNNNGKNPTIVYKDIILMTISEEDGRSLNMTQKEGAEKCTQRIREVLIEYKKARSLKTVLRGIIFSLIVTLIFIIVMTVLNKTLRIINNKIKIWHGGRISDIKMQKLVLITADRIAGVIITVINLCAFIFKLALFYIYLSFIFSFFVWTEDYGEKLLGYIFLSLHIIWAGILFYIPKLLFLLCIAVITYYIIKFIKFIFDELEKGTIEFPGFYKDWAEPTYMIVRFLVIAFAVVIALPYLPAYESPAFKGISVFLGVLFSLGSTAVISNMMAGIILIYMNAFRIGDRIQIGEVTGDVIEKSLYLTRIRTIKNVDITIPNAMILGSHITNYSSCAREKGLILHTTVTIGYDAPWRTVHKLLIDAALSTEGILKEPAPFVYQTSLDDFYVSYQINAYTDKPNSMGGIYSELHQNIQDKFNEGQVEIMSPHYTALRDGNKTTIPENYLPKEYTSPPFKISGEGEMKNP
ncbi:MAG: mechanosensitive ion channel family protein [Candidatus Eremiobacterota bacterium]